MMKTTNTLGILLVGLFMAATAIGATTIWPYELPAKAGPNDQALHCEKANEIIAAGGSLVPGHYYTGFEACKKWCDDNGVPLVAFWSNSDCIHCLYAEWAMNDGSFREWAAANDAGKVIYCFCFNGMSGMPDQKPGTAYTWLKNGSLKSFPFSALYWKKQGASKPTVELHQSGDPLFSDDAFNAGAHLNEESIPERVRVIESKLSTYFKDWHPVPPYAGGYFTQTNYPYASPQAEARTAFVDVEIVRSSLVATNQQMKIFVDGANAGNDPVTINWAENQVAQTNRIEDFDTKWFDKTGRDVVLQLMDGDEVMSELRIACVAPENSTGNPKWIGESFAPGEWTMDFAKAKEKVKNGTDGYKYLLVCAQGSLWCPDCGRVEKNFLGVTDGGGNNRFAKWAKDNKVALVTVDIPNFSSESIEAASPCLLKREAYLTNPESAKESAMHSGLGYLTRNMISDKAAAEALATNHFLVSKMTYEGGFNRPEERDYKGRIYRCGAPVFVLLDKKGDVRAELVRLAEDSPTNSSNFDNYLKRFNEMLDIAGADGNETEIENNYVSKENSIVFAANGGTQKARLCNADMYDTFRLDGFKGNARQVVVVKGDADKGFDGDAELTVEFQKIGADGTKETLGTAVSGQLKNGITNAYTFSEAGDYYVQVRGWGSNRADGYKSAAFSMASTKDGHFQNYSITGSTVAVPQEDKATITPPEGSKTVYVQLAEGVIYRIGGMAEGGCAALAPIEGHPGFFRATASVDMAAVTVAADKTELSYQIWNAGAVGFVQTSAEVTESVCDLTGEPLAIAVNRLHGKSGRVVMSVWVDPSETTLAETRYELIGTNELGQVDVVWEDGKAFTTNVWLLIKDDLFYDGTTKVVLKASVDGGEAGDVGLIPGQDVFTLTVTEDDKQTPGKIYFTRAERGFARKGVIYARAGEGARIYATRNETDGLDGLVAGVLKSTVSGTTFETEDPRNLEDLEQDLPGITDLIPYLRGAKFLYWSSREGGERWVKVANIPAGKTAKVTLTPVGGVRGISASNTVTIVSIADDAPGFAVTEQEWKVYRYVNCGTDFVELTGVKDGDKVSFSKVAGTLPAGLSLSYVEGRMLLSGTTTAKAGVYEPVIQVRANRNGKIVPGMVVVLRLKLVDPTNQQSGQGEDEYNKACHVSRTLKDIPVYRQNGGKEVWRLVGTVQLTIPPNGRISARYTGLDGSISFSSKGWQGLTGDDATLMAELTGSRKGWTMGIEAHPDYSVGLQIDGPLPDGGGAAPHYICSAGGLPWTKDRTAADWADTYTVALKPGDIVVPGTFEKDPDPGRVPAGYGYLTLKMTSASAIRSGTFTMAGMLPNGTAVSGSCTLENSGGAIAGLSICKVSSKDKFSTTLNITAKAKASGERRCVESPVITEGDSDSWTCNGYWEHTEKNASFAREYTAHGSYYDATEDLGGCCEKFYQSTTLNFYVDGAYVGGSAFQPAVKVEAHAIKLQDPNPNGVTLSFNKSTGVVSGTFRHPGQDGRRVSYKGVVVNGWGEDCGCGNYDVYLPFISASCYWSEGTPRQTCGDMVEVTK